MNAAHANTVENLVVFAPLVSDRAGAQHSYALRRHSPARCSSGAGSIYVVVYTAGIPVLRTLAFAGGWIAQIDAGAGDLRHRLAAYRPPGLRVTW